VIYLTSYASACHRGYPLHRCARLRQIASHRHSVAVYHRGFTPAALVPTAREITDSRSVMPILYFPSESLEFDPNVVILTVTMGAADAGAVEAPIFLSTLEKCFRKAVFEPRDGRIL